MRCKNCGTYNDDNRYICETCGSPLYEEEEIQPAEETTKTQTFTAVSENPKPAPQENKTVPHKEEGEAHNEKSPAEKKSVIVIAILVVVLVAIIASVIAVAVNRSNNEDETSTTVSTTQSTETQSQNTTAYTTRQTTTAAPTTTTAPSTTTTVLTWYINANSSGGGTVSGGGEYKNGDKVTLNAVADNGYGFDGWYSDGIKVSSSESYTFTANENASITAVFSEIQTEPDVTDEGDMNFGE